MKTSFLSLFILLCFLLDVSKIASQQNYYHWHLQGNAGFSYYYGDLSYGYRSDKQLNPFYSLQIAKNLSPSFGIRLNGGYGHISGSDRLENWNQNALTDNPNFIRALNFRTQIKDLRLLITYYSDNDRLLSDLSIVSPYLFAGLGLTDFAVSADLFDENGKRYYYWSDNTVRDGPEGSNASVINLDGEYETELGKLKTEGIRYDTRVIHVPFGIGLKFRLNFRWNILLESHFNYTFTDYLDDVSGDYPEEYLFDLQEYASNPSDIIATTRGNENGKNDWYSHTSIGLGYHFRLKKNNLNAPGLLIQNKEFFLLKSSDSSSVTLGIPLLAELPDSVSSSMKKESIPDEIDLRTFYEKEEFALDRVVDTITEVKPSDSTTMIRESIADMTTKVDSTLIPKEENVLETAIDTLLSEEYIGDSLSLMPLIPDTSYTIDSLSFYPVKETVLTDSLYTETPIIDTNTAEIEEDKTTEQIQPIDSVDTSAQTISDIINDTLKVELLKDTQSIVEVIDREQEIADAKILVDTVAYPISSLEPDTIKELITEKEIYDSDLSLNDILEVQTIRDSFQIKKLPYLIPPAELVDNDISPYDIEKIKDSLRAEIEKEYDLKEDKPVISLLSDEPEKESFSENLSDQNQSKQNAYQQEKIDSLGRAIAKEYEQKQSELEAELQRLNEEIEKLSKTTTLDSSNLRRSYPDPQSAAYQQELKSRQIGLEMQLARNSGQPRSMTPQIKYDSARVSKIRDNKAFIDSNLLLISSQLFPDTYGYNKNRINNLKMFIRDFKRANYDYHEIEPTFKYQVKEYENQAEMLERSNEEYKPVKQDKKWWQFWKKDKKLIIDTIPQEITLTDTNTINIDSTTFIDSSYQRIERALADSLNNYKIAIQSLYQEIEALKRSNEQLSSELEAKVLIETRIEVVTDTVVDHRVEIKEMIRYYPKPVVYFKSGSKTVDNQYVKSLSEVAEILEENENLDIELHGFADKTGNPDINRKLSEQRAMAVCNKIVEYAKIDQNRCIIFPFGDQQASDNILSQEAKLMDRRVEVKWKIQY